MYQYIKVIKQANKLWSLKYMYVLLPWKYTSNRTWKTRFEPRILGLRAPYKNRESWFPHRAAFPLYCPQPVEPHTPAHMSTFPSTKLSFLGHSTGPEVYIRRWRGEAHPGPGSRLTAIWAGTFGFWVPGETYKEVKSAPNGHSPLARLTPVQYVGTQSEKAPEQTPLKAGPSPLYLRVVPTEPLNFFRRLMTYIAHLYLEVYYKPVCFLFPNASSLALVF